MTLAPCIYRNSRQDGNPDHWSNRFACSCPAVTGGKRSIFVPKARCNGCNDAQESGNALPVITLNDCSHRGKELRDAPCKCRGIAFRCAVHDYCATGDRDELQDKFDAAGDERKLHDCTGCRDQWIPELDDTEILYVHFNPCAFQRPVANVFRWWESLGPLQRITRGVHLVFREDEPILPNAERIKATAGQFYFIKEALINRAVRTSTKKFVAWVDADIVYPDHRWLMHGLRLLKHFDAVQLWETLDCPTPTGAEPRKRSRAASIVTSGGVDLHSGSPGGAWLMAREKLVDIGGLPELHMTGGGDCVCLDAWTQRDHAAYWTDTSDAVKRLWEADRARCKDIVKRIGYVPVTATHLYHGTRENRRYQERTDMLRGLDPARDIRIADNGLWELANAEILAAVRDYLLSRDEDG